MDETKDGGPAFPRPFSNTGNAYDYTQSIGEQDGMSLRDWFAGQALAGLEIRSDGAYSDFDREMELPELHANWTATAAYRIADAMLAARQKG